MELVETPFRRISVLLGPRGGISTKVGSVPHWNVKFRISPFASFTVPSRKSGVYDNICKISSCADCGCTSKTFALITAESVKGRIGTPFAEPELFIPVMLPVVSFIGCF